MTTIDSKQLVGKPKKIGTLDGKPVMELATKGGLHLVATTIDGKAEVLGTGPHRAVARHIARKSQPDLVLNELSKSDWCPESSYRHHLPKYEALTKALNSRNRK